MQQSFIDAYNENLVLKAELAKKEHMVEKKFFNEVVLRCSRLENCNANLELKLQHQKESFLNNKLLNNQNAPEIQEFFKINEWQAKLNAKDVLIANLRKHIENLKGKNVVEKDVQSNNTKKNADILRELVEQARALRPLDSDLDSAYKCPLTRITSTNVVPPKNPLLAKVAQKTTPRMNNPEMLKDVTNISSISRSKGVESNVVQIVLWYLDFECSKHMTGNRSQLINFIYKFVGIVIFGNDQIAKIMGYDLEVALRKHTFYILDLEGVDLLKGSRGSNLYTLSLEDMMLSSHICLLSKSSKTNLGYGFEGNQTYLIFMSLVLSVTPLMTVKIFYFNPPPSVASTNPAIVAPDPADSTSTPSSTTIDQDAPSTNNDPFFGASIPEPNSEESSSRDIIPTNNYKEALKESCWIEAMQEELNKFERLEVWELVPHPDRVMIITLMWIFKVKLDELGGVLKNKARLVARGYHQEERIDFEESFAPVA
ncbi:retrovirus-related pol polyprotein from transposon TNT 1-94 [Tanacetum coccineum]